MLLVDKWVNTSMWLRQPKLVLLALVNTFLIWVVMWSTNLLLFRSLGIPFGGTAAGLVLVLVYIGLIPALMPGNLGPFYYFTQLSLIPFGLFQTQALSYAVILHAIVTLPPLLFGSVGLLIRPRTRTT